MGAVVYIGICQFVGKLALYFMVIPAAVIGGAYLTGILFLTLREILKK